MNELLLQFTTGKGPAECEWVLAKVVKQFLKEAREERLEANVIKRVLGQEKNTLQSALIMIKGEKCEQFSKKWEGTVKWVAKSPYRKFHKRKNWFVGISRLKGNTKKSSPRINEHDIHYETFRSGGPGGQHVNKVETAVRATHAPTGLSTVCRDSKSQLKNKKEARQKLILLIKSSHITALADQENDIWQHHNDLERGRPIRVFSGGNSKPNHRAKKYRETRKKFNYDQE